jgi:hypothetical protein
MTDTSATKSPNERGIKFSDLIAVLALVVSTLTPLITYLYLNQTERDSRDRKLLVAWITLDGLIGPESVDLSPNAKTKTTIKANYVLWVRKSGSLALNNVQFVLQFGPEIAKHINVAVKSDLETTRSPVDSEGSVRITVKQVAPTAGDIPINILTSFPGDARDVLKPRAVLVGAWLYSEAIAALPIAIPATTEGGGGSGNY